MKPEDAIFLTILAVFVAGYVMRTIAALGMWSELGGIRKELKRGNDHAHRFADFRDYSNDDGY